MLEDTPIKRAVLRRMAELGIGRFNKDLAEVSGVGVVAIGKLLNESTDRPQGRTLKAIPEALPWPPGWLDYVRRGEEVPPDDEQREASRRVTKAVSDAVDPKNWPDPDYRSGAAYEAAVQDFYVAAFEVGTKLANMARDTGVISTIGHRKGRIDADLIVDGETVGVLEVKMWRADDPLPPDVMLSWSEQLQARQLRMTAAHDRDVAVVGWFTEPRIEELVEEYSDYFDELVELGITIAVGDEQLQWALERVAGKDDR